MLAAPPEVSRQPGSRSGLAGASHFVQEPDTFTCRLLEKTRVYDWPGTAKIFHRKGVLRPAGDHPTDQQKRSYTRYYFFPTFSLIHISFSYLRSMAWLVWGRGETTVLCFEMVYVLGKS
jgi:hypothetical protein